MKRRAGIAPFPFGDMMVGMEAVVILLVPLIAVAVYLSARLQGEGIAIDPQQELAQLRERLAWHEDRLRRAKEKNWDDAMVEQIAGQLADARNELIRAMR